MTDTKKSSPEPIEDIMRKLANLIIDRVVEDKMKNQLIVTKNRHKIRPWK